MVEGTGLENRRGFTPSVSSNLTSSAIKFKKIPKSKDLGIFAFQSISKKSYFLSALSCASLKARYSSKVSMASKHF